MRNIRYAKLLEGKKAVVLSGDTPVGRAIVKLFTQHGAQVAYGCLGAQKTGALPGAVHVDLADAASVENFCAAIAKEWPLVDVLVNNPCAQGEQSVESGLGEARFLQVYQHSAVQTLRAFWPAMIAAGGCSVVNISSEDVKLPRPGRAMYAMANGALGGMTRVPAVEGGIHEVRVNEIYAGGDADSAARTALFLAGGMASYISGASIAAK